MALDMGGYPSRPAASSSRLNYHDIIPAESPLRYYRMNELAENVMADSSGNGSNGTYTNSPGLGSTILVVNGIGTSVLFDGTNDYATFTHGMTAPSFACECLVNLDSASKTGVFFGVYIGGASTQRFNLGVGNTNTDTAGNKLVGLQSNVAFHVGPTMGTGVKHVGMVVHNGKMTLWLNGRLSYSNSVSSTSQSIGSTNSFIGSEDGSARFFNGNIAHLAVYDLSGVVGTVNPDFMALSFGALFHEHWIRAKVG